MYMYVYVYVQDFLDRRDVGRPIITFCRALDLMMAGGIPLGQLVCVCKLQVFVLLPSIYLFLFVFLSYLTFVVHVCRLSWLVFQGSASLN